jgi:hypothetical protein
MRQSMEDLITAVVALARIAFVLGCIAFVLGCVAVVGLTGYGFVAFFIREALR